MAEYINRKEALHKISINALAPIAEVYKAVEAVPVEDVQPVKHSKWKLDGEPPWYVRECPECNEKWLHRSGFSMPNYCPNCGARKDGVNNA